MRFLLFVLSATVSISGCASWPLFQPAPPPAPCKCAKPKPVVKTKADCPIKSETQAASATKPKPAPKKVEKSTQPAPTPTLVKQTKVLAKAEATPPPPKAPAAAEVTTKPQPKISKKPVATPAPPLKAPASKPKRKRVLILGDSMAATDFGRELQKKLNREKSIKCFRKGKSSTGLARPDFFDWMGEGAKQVRRTSPDVVIVIVGGNDGQDLIDKEKKKRRVFWKGKKWTKAYAKRTADFIKLLAGEKRQVIWLELPAMDHRSLERKLKIIRKVQEDTIATLGPRVSYLNTRQHFYTSEGKLITKIKAGRKKSRTALRQEDGIHFSLPGSKYFARRVFAQVMKQIKP